MPELDLSDDVWEALRAPAEVPPVGEVVARGRRLRRRRHGAFVGAGAGVVAVAVVLGTTTGGDDRPTQVVAADPPPMMTEATAPVLLRIDTASPSDPHSAPDVDDVVVLTDGTVIVPARRALTTTRPLVWPLLTGSLPPASVDQLTATLATIDPAADLTMSEPATITSTTTATFTREGIERSVTAVQLGLPPDETGPRRSLATLVDQANRLATEAATEPYDPVAYRVRDAGAPDGDGTPMYPGEPTLPDPGGAGPIVDQSRPLQEVIENAADLTTTTSAGTSPASPSTSTATGVLPPTTSPAAGLVEWPLADAPMPPCSIIDDPVAVDDLSRFLATIDVGPDGVAGWLVDGVERDLAVAPLLPGDPGCGDG